MVINITNYVERCSSNKEGNIIFYLVKPLLDSGKKITLSFDGINSISTSFVNSAFIELPNFLDCGKE